VSALWMWDIDIAPFLEEHNRLMDEYDRSLQWFIPTGTKVERVIVKEPHLLIIDEYEQVKAKHKRALAKIFLASKREQVRWLKKAAKKYKWLKVVTK